MTETFYKIKRRSDGLFSTGGYYPNFSKRGKLWKTLGHLRNHLNSVGINRARQVYNDCDIIELVATEHIMASMMLEIETKEQRDREEQIRIQQLRLKDLERRQLAEEEREKEKLIELLNKYPEFEKTPTKGIIKRGD